MIFSASLISHKYLLLITGLCPAPVSRRPLPTGRSVCILIKIKATLGDTLKPWLELAEGLFGSAENNLCAHKDTCNQTRSQAQFQDLPLRLPLALE